MKKIAWFVLAMMLVSGLAFAMASNATGGCQKNQSCMNVWQCYGDTITPCQAEAKTLVGNLSNSNARAYWDAVGVCQARMCAAYLK